MTVEFAYKIDDHVRHKGTAFTGRVTGLFVDRDGIKYVQSEYKTDAGIKTDWWREEDICAVA